MSYSAVIIDDERLARLTLKKDLEKFPEISIVGEASGVAEAIVLINTTKPDLLFLDIQLTDGNGFDLLNQIDYTGKVIFVTAYDEFAIRAFEINALDYLSKPISRQRLKRAIDKLSATDKGSTTQPDIKLEYNDRLLVMHKNSVNFIKINSISYISASREYSHLHTSEGKEYLANKTIGEWERRLPDQNFCRIHRSTIINFDCITKINHHITGTGEVFMQGFPEPLPISRNYFRRLKERYSL